MRSISANDNLAQSGWGQIVSLEARFAPMISRLERSAQSNASGYRRKVVLAGFLGYGVLAGVFLTFAGLAILMIVLMFAVHSGVGIEFKGMIVFGAAALSLIRAMRIVAPPKDGIAVFRAESPELFKMIDEVRALTRGPAVHDVRITDQMNAAITQESKFLFGGVNTLQIGLPLLAAMSTAEVKAVIAHEFGHFVGSHGRSAGFVYRARQRWAQTAQGLPTGIVAGLLRRFFDWYGPWFASYSFVLARRHEYEADRVAARVASARTTADALVRISIQCERYGQAWSAIWSQAPLRDDPPSSPHRTIASIFLGEYQADGEVLGRVLEGEGALDDTHPTLAQRLAALEQVPCLPPLLDQPAAGLLLGAGGDAILDHFDAQWHAVADVEWGKEYRGRQEELAEQEMLRSDLAAGELSHEKLYRHAWLTERIDGAASGAEAYEAVLAYHPNAQDARFRMGDCLLDCGDERGIARVLEAGDAEPVLKAHAYRRVIAFLTALDRSEEAREYYSLLQSLEDEEARVIFEAQSIDESVTLQAIDDATARKIRDTVTGLFGLRSLHVAVRYLESSQNSQMVLIFQTGKGASAQDVLDALLDLLRPMGDLFGIERSKKRRWLAKRIEALPNSRIV